MSVAATGGRPRSSCTATRRRSTRAPCPRASRPATWTAPSNGCTTERSTSTTPSPKSTTPWCGRSPGRSRPAGGSGGGCTRPSCTVPTPRSRSVQSSSSTRWSAPTRSANGWISPPNRGGVPWDTIHLHAVDSDLNTTGEWTIADGALVARARQGRCRVAWPRDGSAAGAHPPKAVGDTDLEVFGDQAVWQSWLDATPF